MTQIIRLTVRERQVLEGLAYGSTLFEVAEQLRIQTGTADGYLSAARHRLGVRATPAALAKGYAIHAIDRPVRLQPDGLDLPPEQQALVPLLAQGLPATEMAVELRRPLKTVRQDARNLMAALKAKNANHTVTRSWQYGLLTSQYVLDLLS